MNPLAANAVPQWTLDPSCRHLNHGSFGAVPAEVQEEQQRLYALMEWNPVRWFATQHERVEEARLEMAEALQVAPDCLAFVHNASAGASAVFYRFFDSRPVNVLTTDHGYGAISMGAARLARTSGGTFRSVPIPLPASDDEVVQLFEAEFARATPTLLVVDQITSATARSFPVDRICALARSHGVVSLVDGAHAPGVLPDPVCREADYWVGNLHKFACAPKGAAVLVSRESDQALNPVIDSWGAELPFPQRFNHAGTIDLTPWIVAPFAWRWVDETVGWSEVRRFSRALADAGSELVARALSEFVSDPLPDVGHSVGPMRLLRLPAGMGETRLEADSLRAPFIDQVGIALSFTSFNRVGYMRVSTHIYNKLDDFEYLATVGVPLLHAWSTANSGGKTE